MKPILSASLINCHAMGMDSIVFKESAPMVRAFITRPDHTLWRNTATLEYILSVAIHMHRQDITMVPLHGEISNVFFDYASLDLFLRAYEYDSQILDGKGGFRSNIPSNRRIGLAAKPLLVPTFLAGDVFHTVYVPKGQTAAWLICEGDKNQWYDSICFTNDEQLEHANFSELYRPMTVERLTEDMAIIADGMAQQKDPRYDH
jgi:hypothetical protein